ncbi:mitochondrial sodium/calcium exchanger protein-like [Oppia nitens]|uniref:mitochondrial sodium/calcium exchanger protein-like n=1 Tax=Oppia nitens TaxID=1686743 RepID=UPI0023DA757C|nr:mitochondrial sodium/calcium exchanger protein-like [Oppia nitens]
MNINNSLIIFDPLLPCQDVNLLNDSQQKCNFVKTVDDCLDTDGLISYVELTYCMIGQPIYAVIVLFLWLLVLFTGLGVTADDFLCPALLVISRTLRLSHNIAGVTFLAFGNGAPDIFSSIAGIKQSNPQLVVGELYGAGIFVTTVVAGSIFILSDFKPMARPMCRDIIFYIVTTFLVWLTFLGGSIKIAHSIAFICIYLFYIITVVGSGIIYTKYLKKSNTDKPSDETPTEISGRVSKLVFSRTYFGQASKTKRTSINDMQDDNYEGVCLRRIKFRDIGVTSPQRRRTLFNIHQPSNSRPVSSGSSSSITGGRDSSGDVFSVTNNKINHNNNNTLTVNDDYIGRTTRSNTVSDPSFPAHSPVGNGSKPKHLQLIHQLSKISMTSLLSNKSSKLAMNDWHEFLIQICPIDWQSFKTDPIHLKIFAIFKAPIYFVLTVTTPVVDEDADRHNWCKILNILHIIISPQAFVFITEMSNDRNYLTEAIVFGVSLLLALVVYFTSETGRPPRYHWLFAYFGFILAVAWIYALANEVVDLLGAVGIIFNLSPMLLGLTVLAWGNSVGDFISNISMARNGFPRMGISACFGGPVLNMLMGIGIPYTVLLSSGTAKPVTLQYTKMVTLLYSTISLSLGSTLLIMLVTKFKATKMHGIYLIGIFGTFLTMACLIEWHII